MSAGSPLLRMVLVNSVIQHQKRYQIPKGLYLEFKCALGNLLMDRLSLDCYWYTVYFSQELKITITRKRLDFS